MITIYDIAKETGYSAPTVSKALNNSKEISEKAKAEIIRVATALGYTPNANAKTLSTKKSYLVGIIYNDFYMQKGMEHPLFAGIIDSFKARMEEAGYEILFLARSLGKKKLSYLEHCRYRHVDAVYIVNSMPDDPNIQELVSSDVLCISGNDPFPGVCTVVSENYQSSRSVISYLTDLGHRDIAHIAGPQNRYSPAAVERLSGYCDELKLQGIQASTDLIIECDFWHAQAGYEAMKKLLEKKLHISAVFCASDTLAYGAMKAAQEADLLIPKDISFVGFDDTEVSAFINPSLTTVRQDKHAMGEKAAELLLKKMEGEEIKGIYRLPTELIKRSSTGAPREDSVHKLKLFR